MKPNSKREYDQEHVCDWLRFCLGLCSPEKDSYLYDSSVEPFRKKRKYFYYTSSYEKGLVD